MARNLERGPADTSTHHKTRERESRYRVSSRVLARSLLVLARASMTAPRGQRLNTALQKPDFQPAIALAGSAA